MSQVGIEVQGRTIVMKLDDRSTNGICAFASDLLAMPCEAGQGPSATFPAGSSGSRDVEPSVQKCKNANDEANAVAQWLLDRHRAGYAWRDMAVLAPGKRNWRDPIARALGAGDIPHRMLLGDKTIGPDFAGDHVHVMTLYAAEGLEFPGVAVVGVGDLPWKSHTLEDAARLLCGAMTRATRVLTIFYSKPSTLVERLLAIARA